MVEAKVGAHKAYVRESVQEGDKFRVHEISDKRNDQTWYGTGSEMGKIIDDLRETSIRERSVISLEREYDLHRQVVRWIRRFRPSVRG